LSVAFVWSVRALWCWKSWRFNW